MYGASTSLVRGIKVSIFDSQSYILWLDCDTGDVYHESINGSETSDFLVTYVPFLKSCNVDIVSPDVPELVEPHGLIQFKMDHF